MLNRDLARLKHMYESSKAILEYLKGKARTDLDNDRMLAAAITREFEILGEAANKISEKTKLNHGEIPWKQIIGMRNQLIHVYFDVDHDIIWKTASEDIPLLFQKLERAISNFIS